MSGSSRSRPKHRLEPITLEELEGTTGMSGFGTLFTRDLSQAVPLLDRLEHDTSAPETGAPEMATTEPGAPVQTSPGSSRVAEVYGRAAGPALSAPLLGAPNSAALDMRAPENHAPESTASTVGALETYELPRKPRIREALTIEDAHSRGEQAVYEVLYRVGRQYQGDSRILTIGLRTLAEMSRMAYSNCKANVRSLAQKLAIEARGDFSYTAGRTYIIYGPEEILRRRRIAGLTHVLRTRGVIFVDPATGAEISACESSAPV